MKHPLLITSDGKIKRIPHRGVIITVPSLGRTTVQNVLTVYAATKNITITIKV